MNRYSRIKDFVMAQDWAMLPSKLESVTEFLQGKFDGIEMSDADIERKLREEGIKAAGKEGMTPEEQALVLRRPAPQRVGSVAVIPVFGVISQRVNMISEFSGGTSTEKLAAQIRGAVEDEDITSIVLDIDSPGGTARGVMEAAEMIMEARKKKPIIAVANGMAASAAFWIAAAATEVVVTPSGEVGSIGVFVMHEDISGAQESIGIKTTMVSAGKFKTEFSPFAPLSQEAQAEMQRRVDEIMTRFTKAVAKGRGVAQAKVKSDFGQGRMLMAEAALKAGMVDRIETMSDVLGRMVRRNRPRRGGASAQSPETIRDFESFLRDEGSYSRAEATRIASRGFGKDVDLREEGDSKKEMLEGLAGLTETLKKT